MLMSFVEVRWSTADDLSLIYKLTGLKTENIWWLIDHDFFRNETLGYGEFSQFVLVSFVQLPTNNGCILYKPTLVIFHVIMIT